MDMDYKPNSNKYKRDQKDTTKEREKVDKVVTGKVKVKKKSEMSKFKDVFIAEDVSNVKSYIFMDVLVPAIKKAISDIVRDGLDMMLYGETKGRKSSGVSSYVSYRDYSNNDRRDDRRVSVRRSSFDIGDIILDSRGEAEEVLERMDEIIDNYGFASVLDLYDLLGATPDFTTNRYGWKSLRTAEVVRVRDGYKLKMPRPTPID